METHFRFCFSIDLVKCQSGPKQCANEKGKDLETKRKEEGGGGSVLNDYEITYHMLNHLVLEIQLGFY